MRRFVEKLRARGELAVVDKEVDGEFELAAVCQATQRTGERPLLFNNVRGTRIPVVTNLYGSRQRLCELIGADDGLFCRRWRDLMTGAAVIENAASPSGSLEYEDISLDELPQLTYQARDAGPYITAGVFLAKHPEGGVPNLSFHRAMHVQHDDAMHVRHDDAMHVSSSEVRIRLGTSHDLTRYQLAAESQNQALEAAILIGAPPAYIFAAAASIPTDASEMELAAKLTSTPPPMRRCRHIDLDVPAETEIVVEGRILPNVMRPEGPFGEFKGLYVEQEDNHVFEVLGVTIRKGALYHGILCGSPEDMRLLEVSVATQIYQKLSEELPGVIDVACIPNVMNTVVKIDPQYDGHANQVIDAAIDVNHDYSKIVVVVDEDVNINDVNDIMWACSNRASAQRDMTIVRDLPGFYRDPHKDHWGRLGIDATKPWGRQAEFDRTTVPGVDGINLRDYFS